MRDAQDPQLHANLTRLGPVKVDHHMQSIKLVCTNLNFYFILLVLPLYLPSIIDSNHDVDWLKSFTLILPPLHSGARKSTDHIPPASNPKPRPTPHKHHIIVCSP